MIWSLSWATLGAGIKQATERGDLHSSPIGEFGIGFFSAFMIADHIRVRTKKQGTADVFEWTSIGTTKYTIVKATENMEPGTSVTVFLQSGSMRLADPAAVQRLITRYCNYIDSSIFITGGPEPVNAGIFPWELTSGREQRESVGRHFREAPIGFQAGKTTLHKQRVAFQYLIACRVSAASRNEIYSKRMFVANRLEILPKELSFIDVVVNCDALTLTLGREDVVGTQTLERLETEITSITLKWLAQLTRDRQKDPHLTSIIKKHQPVFLQLATNDAAVFDRIYEYLLFPLAGGDQHATVKEYIEKAEPLIGQHILYISQSTSGTDRHRLLLRICEEHHIPVFAVNNDVGDLLRRASNKCKKADSESGTCESLLNKVLAAHTNPSVEKVRKNFEMLLGLRCTINAFEPQDLPLVLNNGEVHLNSKNQFLSYLGQLKIRADRVCPLYTSLQRMAVALDKTSLVHYLIIDSKVYTVRFAPNALSLSLRATNQTTPNAAGLRDRRPAAYKLVAAPQAGPAKVRLAARGTESPNNRRSAMPCKAVACRWEIGLSLAIPNNFTDVSLSTASSAVRTASTFPTAVNTR